VAAWEENFERVVVLGFLGLATGGMVPSSIPLSCICMFCEFGTWNAYNIASASFEAIGIRCQRIEWEFCNCLDRKVGHTLEWFVGLEVVGLAAGLTEL